MTSCEIQVQHGRTEPGVFGGRAEFRATIDFRGRVEIRAQLERDPRGYEYAQIVLEPAEWRALVAFVDQKLKERGA